MISVYLGLIGGGKTYSAVWEILRYVAGGGSVWTNIKINEEASRRAIYSIHGLTRDSSAQAAKRIHYLDTTQDGKLMIDAVNVGPASEWYLHVPSGESENRANLVVIDEAAEWVGSHCQKPSEQRPVEQWLQQSRKSSIDVIFITQSEILMARRVRALCAYAYKIKDLSKVRAQLGLIRIRSRVPLIRQHVYDAQSGEIVDTIYLDKTPVIYACYTTSQLYRKTQAASESLRAGWQSVETQSCGISAPLAYAASIIPLIYMVAR